MRKEVERVWVRGIGGKVLDIWESVNIDIKEIPWSGGELEIVSVQLSSAYDNRLFVVVRGMNVEKPRFPKCGIEARWRGGINTTLSAQG